MLSANGINSQFSSLNAAVCPNPTSERITVESKEKQIIYMTLFNMLGAKIAEGEIKGKTELNVSSYNKGVYLIAFHEKNGTKHHYEKVVIE